MAVNVYTPPQAQGEGRVHSRYEIRADAVLVCYGPDAVYGPAGWWRVEAIPEPPRGGVTTVQPVNKTGK